MTCSNDETLRFLFPNLEHIVRVELSCRAMRVLFFKLEGYFPLDTHNLLILVTSGVVSITNGVVRL